MTILRGKGMSGKRDSRCGKCVSGGKSSEKQEQSAESPFHEDNLCNIEPREVIVEEVTANKLKPAGLV
jgi:hypothetical protein